MTYCLELSFESKRSSSPNALLMKSKSLMLTAIYSSIIDSLPSTYPIGVKALQWFNRNIVFHLEGEHPTVLAPLFTIANRVTVTPSSTASSSLTPEVATIAGAGPSVAASEDIGPLIRAQVPGSRGAGTRDADHSLILVMLPPSSSSAPSSIGGSRNGSGRSTPSNAAYMNHGAARGWFGLGSTLSPAKARQQWMSNEEVRKGTVIGSSNVISTDFSNGFIDFKDLSLRIPGMFRSHTVSRRGLK